MVITMGNKNKLSWKSRKIRHVFYFTWLTGGNIGALAPVIIPEPKALRAVPGVNPGRGYYNSSGSGKW
jgi:hypothetical protein